MSVDLERPHFGGSGNDMIYGGSGNDILVGGEGDDQLFGGPGNDWLRGGAGSDILTGGIASDLFYFTSAELVGGVRDTVTDGGTSTNDLIRIDGAEYYQLSVTINLNFITINFDAGSGYIDVSGTGNSPIVVATSPFIASDFSLIPQNSKINLQVSYFDAVDNQPWLKYVELYNSSGHLTRQFGSYDGSGGSWDFLYDAENNEPAYASRLDYFNGGGQKTQEIGTYDNPVSGNTRYIATFDPENSQPFTISTTYYDAQHRPTQVQAFYDDGGSGITTFDPSDTQDFEQYTTYYDSLGQPTQSNGTYDGASGTFYVDFDETNTHPWQSLTALYDQAGDVTQQWLTMDNGAIVYI